MNVAAPSLPTPLISADQLLGLLHHAERPVVLLDACFDLADPLAGERSHAAGHLPGARYIHLGRDLSGPSTGPDGPFRGRHPLPEREIFAATVARFGIAPDTAVVVCDRQSGMFAARVWWMLRWLGHADVAVLDGGVAAWQAAGGRLDADPAPAPRAVPPYPLCEPGMATIDADALQSELGRVRLIDARAPERFRGEVEPIDAAAGHIPGAVNRCFKDNLDAQGQFKPPQRLREEWSLLLDGKDPASVVHQCGSGVSACHNLLAMVAAGWPEGRFYPGSWSEWSSQADRPMVLGGRGVSDRR